MKAPFPYFGGKRAVASDVWRALGDVEHYIEPFFGSGAVLLNRPHSPKLETVNDADGLLSNFWRAVRADPDGTAAAADWPVNEADLHARHLWLIGQRQSLTERLMADPDFYDVKAAGWWVWGACAWIGSGWCEANGPWIAVDGVFTDSRQLPHLGDCGQGINRQLPHLGGCGQGINRQLPHLGDCGHGINRQLLHLDDCGKGINRGKQRSEFIRQWFNELSNRLRDVRVACGDWTRVLGKSVLRAAGGGTGVFLDPPYSHDMRNPKLYACDSDVARDVRQWCEANGNNPALRIVLAGYEGEHNRLESLGWRVKAWKSLGGYGNQGNGRGAENAHKERLWFSPYCLDCSAEQLSLI
jgi:hypothetical protein